MFSYRLFTQHARQKPSFLKSGKKFSLMEVHTQTLRCLYLPLISISVRALRCGYPHGPPTA